LTSTAILLAEHRKSKRNEQIAGHCQHGARGAPDCPREQGTSTGKRTVLALSATHSGSSRERKGAKERSPHVQIKLPASKPTIQTLFYQIRRQKCTQQSQEHGHLKLKDFVKTLVQ